MDPRSITLAHVIEELQDTHDIEETVLGEGKNKQTVLTRKGVIIHSHDAAFSLAQEEAREFKKMINELELTPASHVNQASLTNQRTVLMQAIIKGDLYLVKVLLNYGADPTLCDDKGNNAFIYAAKQKNTAILNELFSLIQQDHQQQKKNIEQQKSNQPTTKSTSTSKKEYEHNEISTKKPQEKPTLRIRLTLEQVAEILKKENKEKQSVKLLIEGLHGELKEEYEKENKDKEHKNSPLKKREESQQHPIDHVKALINEIEAIKEKKQTQGDKKDSEEKDREAKEKIAAAAEQNRLAAIAQEEAKKYEEAKSIYNDFFNQKMVVFRPLRRQMLAQDQIEFEERQHIRRSRSQGHVQKSLPTPAALPSYTEDQTKIKAALCLLKDYYAPESAPLPRFLQWGWLRRLLTFHWGRRYANKAEELYTKLAFLPTEDIPNVIKIHELIQEELNGLNGITHLTHHRQYNGREVKNNIINSSYTRRLSYIEATLRSTYAYQYTEQVKDTQKYSKSKDEEIQQLTEVYLENFDNKHHCPKMQQFRRNQYRAEKNQNRTDGCDLALYDLHDQKEIQDTFYEITNRAEQTMTPALMQTQNNFLLYIVKKEKRNWDYIELALNTPGLKDLPFNQGIIQRNHPQFPRQLIDKHTQELLPTPTTLPPDAKDQATIEAALCLIKDYYAPQSAPLPRFLQWGWLRRLLTFHWGRRYSDRAEALYTKLAPHSTVDIHNVMEVHKIIQEELDHVTGLTHHYQDDGTAVRNNINESTYTRRLANIEAALQSTHAYQYVQKHPTGTVISLSIYPPSITALHYQEGLAKDDDEKPDDEPSLSSTQRTHSQTSLRFTANLSSSTKSAALNDDEPSSSSTSTQRNHSQTSLCFTTNLGSITHPTDSNSEEIDDEEMANSTFGQACQPKRYKRP